MKRPKCLQLILRLGGILFLLSACGTYTSTPIKNPPASTQVSQPTNGNLEPIPTPNPGSSLTGSVLLEDGRCCISGLEGDTVQVQARFSATSSIGNVTEMRVSEASGCAAEPQMEEAAWETFAPTRTFPVVVSINWVGFYMSVQFKDDHQNLSPIYCDDVGVEGTARVPSVDATDWYAQIQCFADNEIHPGPGESVSKGSVVFNWPNKNRLPEGVYYKVSVYSAVDQYTALAATGQTRETSLALPIPPEDAGDMVWYVTLVDANGTFLDHGRCSSFAASLLTVNPSSGIKGIHFLYKP